MYLDHTEKNKGSVLVYFQMGRGNILGMCPHFPGVDTYSFKVISPVANLFECNF